MSDLITKTLISLNIIRPSNKIFLYDDGKYACLLYKSIQTGGGNLRFPQWQSLELVPKNDYHYDKNKFYNLIEDSLLSVGIDGQKKQLIFGLKINSDIFTGSNAINKYPQAGGVRENLFKLQNTLKKINLNKITLTNPSELNNIIMCATKFTNDAVCTMDGLCESGQYGGGYGHDSNTSEPMSPSYDFNNDSYDIKNIIDSIIDTRVKKIRPNRNIKLKIK
jgi:hypothetical protein